MKILAIGAHVDDIEFGCGGFLADAVIKGHRVKMIVMTHSAYQDLNGQMAKSKTTAKKEGQAAAKILGVTDFKILGFETKNLPYNQKTVETLDRKISDFKPDLILTHWPHDTHQDHRHAALATISAARYFNKILLYEPMMPSGRSYQGFRGQAYYALSEKAFNKKLKALETHQTEIKKYGRRVLEAVKARAIYRGYEISKPYAECLEVMRWQIKL